jgi:hypothetical protein
MSIRAGRDLLHDAVSMTRAISEGEQNMQDLRFQRQQVIDVSWSVRHAGNLRRVYTIQYINVIITTSKAIVQDLRNARLGLGDDFERIVDQPETSVRPWLQLNGQPHLE